MNILSPYSGDSVQGNKKGLQLVQATVEQFIGLFSKGYNKDCVNYLNKLTDLSGAKIVVISDCKKRMSVEELEKCFKDEGITGKVIGKTVDINKKLRTLQIKDWFKSNDEPRNWVVLDDTHYDDYSEIPDHVVFTKSKKGLGKSEFESALKILE